MKIRTFPLLLAVVIAILLAGACAPSTPAAAPPTTALLTATGVAPTTAPPTPTAAPPTPTPDPRAAVKAWVTATNKGDVDGALALFNDALSFMLFDTAASNKDQLRSIFDWAAGQETEFQVKDCQLKPDIIICTVLVLDACMTASGLTNGLPVDMVFTIGGDGKIQRVTGALSGMAWPDYSSAFVFPQEQWLRANFADEAKKISTLQDRREAGALQARMCRAYAESLKVTPTPTAVPPSPTPATDASVKALVTAINSGDVSGALALFDDKLNFMLGGDYTASNKEQLRSIYDWFAGLETRLLVKDCQPRQDVVLCTGSWIDACIAASGATSGPSINLVFTVGQDGKIQKLTGARSGMEWNDYGKFVNAGSLWQQANFADDDKRVDTLEDRREAGAIQSRLCRAYADSLK